ncbi:hypothetical protein BBJ28_00021850, partial [Nothophytophthora sp. Chile5]
LSILVQRGLLNAGVDPSNFYGLEDIPSAIDYMYERKNIGKLVVDLTKGAPRLIGANMAAKLRIPVISFKEGLADAVKQRLLTTESPARALFQAGKLEFVTLPTPSFPQASSAPGAKPESEQEQQEASGPPQTKWELTAEQQEVLTQATVVLGDAHNCAPLLLTPEVGLPKDKQHLLKKVQWVQGTYAGVERYLKLLTPDGPKPQLTLTRAGGINGLAQYVFGWIITIERKFHEAHAMQKQKMFDPAALTYRSFPSVTVGILGLGAIGQAIGRLAKLAGFHVIGFKRQLRGDEDETFKNCAHRVSTDLDEVLQTADYIVSILPSTPATKYLLNETNLPGCQEKKPVFINVGRGDVISEKMIVQALDRQWFSKVVLDVFEKEPLPDDSPLWDHPKVFLTPHVAAFCFNEDIADVFVPNLNAYLAKKPLNYLVDWSIEKEILLERGPKQTAGDEQRRALLPLVRKCINRQEREQMYEANGVHVLSEVVSSGDAYLTQLYALKCLGWATSDASKLSESAFEKLRESVREATPEELTSLVDVLQHGNHEEKDGGAVLCASVATRGQSDALRDVGVVPPLIEMLKGGSALQTLWAANALGTLACSNNENRVTIAGAGGTTPLVVLLRTGAEEQIHQAARALGNIAINNANVAVIVREEAISPLVTLVRLGTDEQKQFAAYTLGNLADSEENSAAIASEDAISPLVTLLETGTDDQKEEAAYALGRLAEDNDANRAAIALAGGVASLVVIVRTGTDAQKEWAAYALRQLANNEENCVVIAREGGIPPLVELLRATSSEQSVQAARALGSLAHTNAANRVEMARDGGISLLVALVRAGTDEQKHWAALVLGNIAVSNDANCVEIAREGGISPLVALVRAGTDQQKQWAAFALGKLAFNIEANRVEISRDGGISPLVALVRAGTDQQKQRAALALGNIAVSNDANCVEIAREGGIPPLMALERSGTDEQKQYAAFALSNLAKNDANTVIEDPASNVVHTESSSQLKSTETRTAGKMALDFATMESYRFKGDDLETRTSIDQTECESSCSLFFFPMPELPIDQQLQLQELGFVNLALEVCRRLLSSSSPLLMREKHVDYLKRGLTRLSSGFVALDARYPLAACLIAFGDVG